MKSNIWQSLCGMTALLIGSVGLCGLWLPIPEALRIAPGARGTAFYTGLGFLVTAALLCLHSGATASGWVRRAQVGTGYALLASGLFFLADHSLREFSSFYEALPFLRQLTYAAESSIVHSAFAFSILGLLLIVKTKQARRAYALATQVLTFVLMGVGIVGLVGAAMKLNILFDWFPAVHIDVPTAAGLIALAGGVWASWHKALWQNSETLRVDEKLSFVGAAVLFVIALATGLTGFSMLQGPMEQALKNGLSQNLDSRLFYFRTLVHDARYSTERISRRPVMRQMVKDMLADPSDAGVRLKLQRQLESIIAVDYHGAAILDKQGKVLLKVGRFIDPEMKADLDQRGTELALRDKIYHLNITTPLLDEQKRPIAQLYLELPDYDLTQLIMGHVGFGHTGELVLCRRNAEVVECWPQHRQVQAYYLPTLSIADKRPPIIRALEGKSGIMPGQDYRGTEVLAAYAPLGLGGFGLVLKQDQAEMYRPITQRLVQAIPILLLMIAGGVWLLRAQVRPLTRKLVESERAARRAEGVALENEARIHAVVDTIGEGVITIDTTGAIQSLNPAACEIFGYAANELVGQNLQRLMPSGMNPLHEQSIQRYLQTGVSHIIGRRSVELPALRKDGSLFPIELSITTLELPDRLLFVVIVRDIAARKAAEQILYAEKERLHITLESIGDAVITADTDGKATYLNPVAEAMTGWTTDEALGLPIESVFHIIDGKTRAPAPNPVDLVLRNDQASGALIETVLIRRHDKVEFAIDDSAAPIRNQAGEIIGVVLVFHDVTEARRLAEQISHQAAHDVLTGLINRREFERRLELALDRERAEEKGHALLYLDLDQFKIVNDTCGHVAGDELLIQVTALFKQQLRDSDTFARLGGDEFAVILENCPLEPAQRVAESLRRAIGEFHFVWQNKAFNVGVSIGLVTFGKDDGMTLSDVLSAADSACYIAKEKGRNRIHTYHADDAELSKRQGEMSWVSRIQNALQENRFVLYAQKIECLMDVPSDMLHYELLIRMIGENGELIPPMAFIPAAERYNQMPAIDRWVIKRGLQYLQQTRADGQRNLCLSINLSGASLNDEGLLSYILEEFALSAVPHSAVCFEVTETAAIANLTQASRLIQALKLEGCRFSLDDFGSGMSSFAYLKHLPVDYLKIDGGFVKDIASDPIDFAMVEAINNIGQVMGIETIAEFMENDAIRSRLVEIGVNYAQGYGIARPAPLSEIGRRP